MTKEEILERARKQRAMQTGSAGPVSKGSREAILEKARAQRAAVGGTSEQTQAPTQAPPTQPQAPQGSSAGALGKAAVGAMGPLGSIANLTGRTEDVLGGLEAGASMVSGILAEPVAGLAGLGAAAFGGADAGADMVEATREALTYQPRSQEGKESLEAVGGALAPVGEALTATSEALGDTAYDITGSPAIATVFYTLPDAALEVTGLGLGGKAARTARLAKQSNEVKAVTELLTDPEVRVADPVGAKWKLDKDGVAVPNEMGRKLLDSKVVSGSDAALITNSNKTTRTQMDAMTEAFNRRAEGDPRGLSPNEIIGANGAKALSEANKARKAVGSEMDALIKGPVGQTPVDVRPVIDGFYAQLSELGVSPKVNMNTGKAELDFRGSELDLKSYAGARKLMSDAFEISTTRGRTTLADVHKMKKQLDDLLDAKKLEQGGTLGNMERKLLTLRSGLNDAAKGVKGYGELNAKYSALVDGLRPFDSYRPAGMSWEDADVASNIGAALKSAAADTANVNKMLRGLTGLNTAMKNAGAKPFSVDVAGLARYSDFLNNNWSRTVAESQPKAGFFSKAGKNAEGAALSVMVGNKFGVANNVAGLVANGLDARAASQVAKKAKENQRLVRQALRAE